MYYSIVLFSDKKNSYIVQIMSTLTNKPTSRGLCYLGMMSSSLLLDIKENSTSLAPCSQENNYDKFQPGGYGHVTYVISGLKTLAWVTHSSLCFSVELTKKYTLPMKCKYCIMEPL